MALQDFPTLQNPSRQGLALTGISLTIHHLAAMMREPLSYAAGRYVNACNPKP
jgi:hypothetical protein